MTPDDDRQRARRPGGAKGRARERIPLPSSLRKAGFTVADAHLAGVGRGRLENANLDRAFHGVRVAPPSETDEARLGRMTQLERAIELGRRRDLSYAARARQRQAFGAVSAARILGLPLPARLARDTRVHLIVPQGFSSSSPRGTTTRIVPQRAWRTFDFEGLLLPSPELIFCLLARDLEVEDLLVLADALVTTSRWYPARRWDGALSTPERLASASLAWSPCTGASRLREVVPLIRPLVESPYETIMRFQLEQSGYPTLVVQHLLYGPDGRKVARGDCADLEARILYDYDGDGHRTSRSQWQKDVRRARRVANLDWHPERVVLADLWPDPSAFIAHAHALRPRRLAAR